MSAFQSQNSRKSIVAETLQKLSHEAQLWHDRLNLIEAGQPINRAELMADFDTLLENCQNLRDAILSEDSSAQWTTREELHALVERLDGVAALRTRYLDLANVLASGTVVHRRARTRQERLEQRDAAVAELMEISGHAAPPELPGPEAEVWLQWACGLEDGSSDPGLLQLQKCFPRVDDFVRQLDIETWQDGLHAGLTAKQTMTPATEPESAPAVRPMSAITGAPVAKSPAAEEHEVPQETVPEQRVVSEPVEALSAAAEEPAIAEHAAAGLAEDSAYDWNIHASNKADEPVLDGTMAATPVREPLPDFFAASASASSGPFHPQPATTAAPETPSPVMPSYDWTPVSAPAMNSTPAIGDADASSIAARVAAAIAAPVTVALPIEESEAAQESSLAVGVATEVEDNPVAQEAEENREIEQALSKRRRTRAKNGITFFPEEEVECFSLYLEKAKREPKDARKVRALFAISHWLNPIDQNPVSHPICGIRSQVSYSGATDLVPSSPDDASKAISSHAKLLLFTGGADLLRWSLSQPSNGHFDALATVRRLTLDHIRTWFHDLYKIELSDAQLNDIYRLTSGIPLLVGEMHRLIVHDADAPPAWLGFELWTTVLTNYGNRLPAIAHELTHGNSMTRLTAREIEILKMLVIASDDFATPGTIVSSLMADWPQYGHPELHALSTEDAESVTLLQRLGLLPTREGSSTSPIQALVPLEPGDALRQVVRYL